MGWSDLAYVLWFFFRDRYIICLQTIHADRTPILSTYSLGKMVRNPRKRELAKILKKLAVPVSNRTSFDSMRELLPTHHTLFIFAVYQQLESLYQLGREYFRGCRTEDITIMIPGFRYTMDSIVSTESKFTVHGIAVYKIGCQLGILVDDVEAACIDLRNSGSDDEISPPKPGPLVGHQFQCRPNLQIYYDCIKQSDMWFIDWHQ